MSGKMIPCTGLNDSSKNEKGSSMMAHGHTALLFQIQPSEHRVKLPSFSSWWQTCIVRFPSDTFWHIVFIFFLEKTAYWQMRWGWERPFSQSLFCLRFSTWASAGPSSSSPLCLPSPTGRGSFVHGHTWMSSCITALRSAGRWSFSTRCFTETRR